MKKITLGILTLAIAVFFFTPVAVAADGAKIFQANCAGCHANGTNRIDPDKTLKQGDLKKWEINSANKIIDLVNRGKFAMPGFRDRLEKDEIKSVANYVLEQAANDWKL